MARSERNARHDDRYPAIDPYFSGGPYQPSVSYSARNNLDPTGYSVSDLELAGRLHDVPIDPEVRAPLGGDLVGRLAPSSYGNEEGPRPGGYLTDLAQYQEDYRVLAEGGRGIEGGGLSTARGGLPGGASIRSRLGVPWQDDDTGFAGVGSGKQYLTEQHAMARAPLVETQVHGVGTPIPGDSSMNAPSSSGWVPEHVNTRVNRYAAAGLYEGGFGFGGYRSGAEDRSTDFDGDGYPKVVSQMVRGEDGAGSIGGGDYGDTSPSEELANIRRENDSGDEYAGSGWSQVPSAFERRRNVNSDYDR